MALGVTLGLIAGYYGGGIDTVIMRIADVQLTSPAILTALLIDGVARVLLGSHTGAGGEFGILVISIGLSYWVQYARTVRGITLVERNKEYVQAARLIGLGSFDIMFRQVLPNVISPALVIATIKSGLGDPHGGDAVVPRSRAATQRAVARHADSYWQQLSDARRVLDRYVSWHGARRTGPRREPARRLAPGRTQPQTEIATLG
jgi:hypothetical protein